MQLLCIIGLYPLSHGAFSAVPAILVRKQGEPLRLESGLSFKSAMVVSGRIDYASFQARYVSMI